MMDRRRAVTTVNVNGWDAKPPGRREMRKVVLFSMVRQHKLDTAAVHGHPLFSQEVLASHNFWARKEVPCAQQQCQGPDGQHDKRPIHPNNIPLVITGR